MSGPTNRQVIEHWAQNAGNPDGSTLHGENSVITSTDGTTLWSYGSHFPLGQIVAVDQNPRGFWLLNGDRWHGPSGWGGAGLGSTAAQQQAVRDAVSKTGLPVLIVPDSCLTTAGIERASIRPVEITADTVEVMPHQVPSFNTVPMWLRDAYARERSQGATPDQIAAMPLLGGVAHNFRELPDGRWAWDSAEHLLGQSLFRASFTYRDRTAREDVHGSAYFLSGFDMQEWAGAYFLCQLPHGAQPRTVAEAFETLKPEAVTDAEALGLEVLRQGDIYAIPRPEAVMTRPEIKRMAYVLGTNHAASQVVERRGAPYARGILWHKPRGRRPDHRRLHLGTGRTWYRLVKNTVPVDVNGESRSWSPPGDNGGRGRVD